MNPLPRPPLTGRLSPAGHAAVTWCAAAAFPVCVLLVVTLQRGTGGIGSSNTKLAVALAAGTALPFGLLRRWPLPALVLILAGALAGAELFLHWAPRLCYLQFLAADLALCYIAAARPRRTSAAAGLMTLIALGVMTAMQGRVNTDLLLVAALTTVLAWVAGSSLRQRRDYAAALRAQATAQAVTAERLRIARDLHDLVAHSIGVIAFQAGMGSRVIGTQPGEARDALLAIETASRETLAGLRRMLGALRPAGPDSGAAAPLGPSPRLADLGLLAVTAAHAGIRMDVTWSGERRPLPAEIELSAFRIIQEAVTNVVRHARTDWCQVSVCYGARELSVEITDDGDGSALTPGGYGITGMRERAELLDGQLTAGPRPDGGYGVTARLPVAVPDASAIR
jgi:signal transduction histidine kinase